MRSKRYQEIKKFIDPTKLYPLAEALDILKKTAKAKFDESVEVHLCLGIDPAKSEQSVRGSVLLPQGSGKSKKVAVLSSNLDKLKEAKAAGADITAGPELMEEIKAGKINFDILVATPEIMKDLAKLAKTLGPKGLMPNPKNETVTQNIKGVVSALKKGKVDFKNDETGNIHQVVGKISWDQEKLKENISAILEAIKKAKPASAKGDYLLSLTLTTTMGPGIKVQI